MPGRQPIRAPGALRRGHSAAKRHHAEQHHRAARHRHDTGDSAAGHTWLQPADHTEVGEFSEGLGEMGDVRDVSRNPTKLGWRSGTAGRIASMSDPPPAPHPHPTHPPPPPEIPQPEPIGVPTPAPETVPSPDEPGGVPPTAPPEIPLTR